MAEHGEWNRKGATLSDVTAEAEYGVSRDFIVKEGWTKHNLRVCVMVKSILNIDN